MSLLNRSKRLPVWMRTILAIVLTIIGAGIWGFMTHLMGVPKLLVGIGVVLIGAVPLTYLFGGDHSHD